MPRPRCDQFQLRTLNKLFAHHALARCMGIAGAGPCCSDSRPAGIWCVATGQPAGQTLHGELHLAKLQATDRPFWVQEGDLPPTRCTVAKWLPFCFFPLLVFGTGPVLSKKENPQPMWASSFCPMCLFGLLRFASIRAGGRMRRRAASTRLAHRGLSSSIPATNLRWSTPGLVN